MKHKLKFHKEDFVQNFKDKCFICGVDIETDWESYQKRGNVCVWCSTKAEKNTNYKK